MLFYSSCSCPPRNKPLTRLWSELAFAPFHQTLRAWTRLKRHLRREEPLHDAVGNSGWHIGGWPSSADELPRGKPLAVLDVTAELPRAHEQPHYLNLAVWDMHGVSLMRAGVHYPCFFSVAPM